MRVLPLLLALLLLAAPLAVAQGSSTSGSSSSSTTSQDPEAHDPGDDPEGQDCDREDADCKDDEAHANETKADDGNQTRPNATSKPAPARLARWCDSADRRPTEQESCRRLLASFARGGEGRWVTFRVDETNRSLLDVKVQDLTLLDRVSLALVGHEIEVEREDHALTIGDDQAELRLQDSPTAAMRFKGEHGNVTLVFPASSTIFSTDSGARIQYGNGSVRMHGQLVADELDWLDAHTVRVSGFFSFHVAAALVADETPRVAVQDAIERRKIGAEVSLRRADASATGLAASQDVEVLAYDDVNVTIHGADGRAAGSPLRIEVDADLDEGRTIVVHVEDGVLNSTDPEHLLLRYFDLHPQPDGSVLETEIVLAMASSLADVLDPTDDGGQPEYWLVEDADGLQVLFSVPHWSAHALTISSLAAFPAAPSVLFGLMAGAVGCVGAAAVMLRPRRRDDEF